MSDQPNQPPKMSELQKHIWADIHRMQELGFDPEIMIEVLGPALNQEQIDAIQNSSNEPA